MSVSRNRIVEKLTNKRVKDYSFTIVFFVVFSFFIVFAIRPNLNTVFTLQRQLTELRALDANYENVILHIVDLQTLLENNRDNLYLLDQGLPPTPQVNKVIDDLKRSASEAGLVMKKIDIGEVSLKEDVRKKDLRAFSVAIETDSAFPSIQEFVDRFLTQRRLKMLKNLSIIKESKDSTDSSKLKIKMEVSGYYL